MRVHVRSHNHPVEFLTPVGVLLAEKGLPKHSVDLHAQDKLSPGGLSSSKFVRFFHDFDPDQCNFVPGCCPSDLAYPDSDW